jgi:MOSC domain-containing protein YiiM
MKVIAVSCDGVHRFSKPNRLSIRLIAGYGIEGDAHAGRFIQHRYQARQMPNMPNNRQVHLIQSELFDDLKKLGFEVKAGDLGENITTLGIDLLELPLGTLLHLGKTAVVELTGLRTPCGYIDRFHKGLKRAMILRTPDGHTFRSGVLGIVRSGGDLHSNDPIFPELAATQARLPAI